jgi:hypothetical protein
LLLHGVNSKIGGVKRAPLAPILARLSIGCDRRQGPVNLN